MSNVINLCTYRIRQETCPKKQAQLAIKFLNLSDQNKLRLKKFKRKTA